LAGPDTTALEAAQGGHPCTDGCGRFLEGDIGRFDGDQTIFRHAFVLGMTAKAYLEGRGENRVTTLKRVTCLPAASISPAGSMPKIGRLGLRRPK